MSPALVAALMMISTSNMPVVPLDVFQLGRLRTEPTGMLIRPMNTLWTWHLVKLTWPELRTRRGGSCRNTVRAVSRRRQSQYSPSPTTTATYSSSVTGETNVLGRNVCPKFMPASHPTVCSIKTGACHLPSAIAVSSARVPSAPAFRIILHNMEIIFNLM